ncbi:MAG TPA: hypothetical protein VMW82_01315 [Candidatus Paceibacterota bacterium]|nr:hypothetical protein [Candidatus Paceibacterota bacterium]
MKIANFFLWAMTLIGLVISIIGAIGLVDLALKTWVFTKADDECYYYDAVRVPEEKTGSVVSEVDYQKQCLENQTARRQSKAATSIAQIIIGVPVFLFFFKTAKSYKA